MHANIETDADINANTDANTNVHADILFRSFAREDAPVLPLFGVLPSFCSSPTAGRVSISWRSHVGAWPGEVLSEQPQIKNQNLAGLPKK